MARAPHSTDDDRAKSKRVGALAELWPFLRPYRVMMTAAILALVVTAVISLMLPIAVRRVVDNFDTSSGQLLDQYFGAALLIAGLLALGTAVRYYLVTRLGERVVADIRTAVYDRMISMSPAFFERIMTGEVLSRITTDTTLILSVIGSSVSIALRNLLLFMGGLVLMLFTSAKVAQLAVLPQGKPEADRRVKAMSDEQKKQGFGNCTNHYECQASCPKGIDVKFIAKLNREYIKSLF